MEKTPKRKTKSTLAWVRSQCEGMRRHVLARHIRTEAQVDAEWPKGKAVRDWIQAYGTLRAWVWEAGTGPSNSAEAEERMLLALRDKPHEVRMLDGEVLKCYPKGLDSLMWYRQQDWLLDWLGPRIVALREALNDGAGTPQDLPNPVTALASAEQEIAWQVGAFCAEATREGADRGPWANDDTDLPERWRDVDPLDVISVHRGFVECNAARLEALSRLVKPTRGAAGERLSWNVFMGSMAMRLGVDPATLARDRSLVSLLATVRLAREAEPEVPGE